MHSHAFMHDARRETSLRTPNHGILLVNATHAARCLLARAADNWKDFQESWWRREHKASRPYRQDSSRTNLAGTCKSLQAEFRSE